MTRSPGRVKSVAKAAQILRCFSPHTQVLSTRSLERVTGVPRSTVHALCATLCDAGLLQEVPGRGYALGLELIALGGQVMHRHNLIEASEGMLAPLIVHDGTWALVGQLVDGWIVYLARQTAPRHERVNSRAGLRVPAHRTACGKAALSMLPAADVAHRVHVACEAERMASPDMAALQRELAAARSDGYVASADWRPGRMAIGAPIVDHDGHVVGGVSLGGPRRLFSPELTRWASGGVIRTAARIGERLRASDLASPARG